MKTLFTTTAMVLALGLPMSTFAQTADPVAPAAGAEVAATPGFLAARGLNNVLATDLIGQDVYARRVPVDMVASPNADGVTGTTMVVAADLESMDNVGQINDIVLSTDGTVAAVVIGIGGFLGVGEQDVAVTMDQVSFATRSDEDHAMIVVVNTGAEMLKTSPMFDRMSAMNAADGTMTPKATEEQSDRAMLKAPMMEREGYQRVEAKDVSIDTLIGKSVYGVNDQDVGTVDDVIVGDSGMVQEVVIDFGGFLGMGTTKVSLGFDELTILTKDGNADIRVYVDATEEQIRALPVYVATN